MTGTSSVEGVIDIVVVTRVGVTVGIVGMTVAVVLVSAVVVNVEVGGLVGG